MVGLQRVFKVICLPLIMSGMQIMDDNDSKSLDTYEFKKAVKDFRVEIPDQHIDTIFKAFDIN